MNRTIQYYNQHSSSLFKQYESVNAADIHNDWSHLIPDGDGLSLDIGAGSGRDANWLASQGFDVIAVEPSDNLRGLAKRQNGSAKVTWVNDTLPELKSIYRLNIKFDLILLSAVWMHIPESQRERAFRKISNLLKPGGKLVISLRHGTKTDDRDMYDVSFSQVLKYSQNHALTLLIHQKNDDDKLKRDNVSWETVVFQLPDDGTGAFPLIRNIIVNDSKASTYKLALLRVILKIADTMPSVAHDNGDCVSIPLGLVSLLWLRQYHQLLSPIYNLQQQPNSTTNLGFISDDGFRSLDNLVTADLSISNNFSGSLSIALFKSLKDVSSVIKNMPVKYITYPSTGEQIFSVNRNKIKSGDNLNLTVQQLQAFGSFNVPKHLWNSMTQYAVWIEPAIVHEWIIQMQSYKNNKRRNLEYSFYLEGLQWLEPIRNTTEVRQLISEMQNNGNKIYCVWTGKKLDNKYEVDHCFPFSRWQNNDLWNLLPSSEKANGKKSDKLPTLELLDDSKERIINWWGQSYLESDLLKHRFHQQAECSLPLIDESSDLETIYSGMEYQRTRLKQLLQLQDWNG